MPSLSLWTVVKSNDLVVDKGDLTNSELSYYYYADAAAANVLHAEDDWIWIRDDSRTRPGLMSPESRINSRLPDGSTAVVCQGG